MIKCIAIKTGYAENNSISTLIFGLDCTGMKSGFESRIDGLKSLSLDLFKKF